MGIERGVARRNALTNLTNLWVGEMTVWEDASGLDYLALNDYRFNDLRTEQSDS